MDGELSADDAHALAHAHQSQTVFGLLARDEAAAVIGNAKLHQARLRLQLDLRLFRAAVLHDVVQRFLRDPIQVQRGVGVDGWTIAGVAEIDGNLVFLRDVAAQAFERRDESQRFDLRWMQLVRKVVHVAGNLGDELRQPPKRAFLPPRLDGTVGRELIDFDAEQRELLTEIVVQIAGDPTALLFLLDDQAPRKRTILEMTETQRRFSFAERALNAPRLSTAACVVQQQREREQEGDDDEAGQPYAPHDAGSGDLPDK